MDDKMFLPNPRAHNYKLMTTRKCTMLNQDQINNYSTMSIRKLDQELRKNGFNYKLVKRTVTKLMYSQHSADGNIVAYEVFLNKIGDLRKAKQRWAKLQSKDFDPNEYEEFYEVFPSDEEFGSRAFTYSTLEAAEKAFASK